ncbi:MAG: hypothetical protein HY770_07285, partial [Chitinivibrionia bacterium]|nr:hypothetical protein [Chitinivibrionia bacterium]
MTHPEPRRDWCFAAIVLVSFAFCLVFSLIDLNFFSPYFFSDLGHQLYNFKMTAMGEVPYRDFWENWAPGTFYLNALAFRIFGVSIYTTKLLLAVIIAVSSTTLYLICRNVVPRPVALTAALTSLLWGNFTLNVPYSGW